MLNCFGVDHECDRRTDFLVANAVFNHVAWLTRLNQYTSHTNTTETDTNVMAWHNKHYKICHMKI